MFELVFRKKDSTKHALIAMLEKARKVLGQMEHLSRFHQIFNMNPRNLIFDYLTGRKQKVEMNSTFSSYM